VFTAVLELELRPDHQVDYRPGYQDLSGGRQTLYALSEVDGDARYIVAAALDLSDVEPNTDVQTELTDRVSDSRCTLHCPGRGIERGKYTITGPFHEMSTESK
jgi:hypothetical protein